MKAEAAVGRKSEYKILQDSTLLEDRSIPPSRFYL